MGFMERVRPAPRHRAAEDEDHDASFNVTAAPLGPHEGGAVPLGDPTEGKDTDKIPSEGLQGGVQDIEAMTVTWSKKSLILAFIL